MNYDLLDENFRQCGAASIDAILALRWRREDPYQLGCDDDGPLLGAQYYQITEGFRIAMVAAEPTLVTIARIAGSACWTYDALIGGAEFLPEPVWAYNQWALLLSCSRALAADAWRGANRSGAFCPERDRVTCRNRTVVIEALERLALELDVEHPVRQGVRQFVHALLGECLTHETPSVESR